MNWKYILCLSLSLLFFIQMCPIPESARSMDYYPPHPGDCAYVINSIQSQWAISLDEVRLNINDQQGHLIFSESFSIFNTSGDLYYRNVKFIRAATVEQLSVGDALFFNKTAYLGSTFLITNSESTRQLSGDIEIADNGTFGVYVTHGGDGAPDSILPTIVFGAMLLMTISLIAYCVNRVKRNKKKS